jgi:1-acyl-sn-glycerol-3-phosphate acyltransferase
MGLLAFVAMAVNTIICFVPLIFLAFIKLLVPLTAVRRIITRWIMGVGVIWVSFNTWLFGLLNNTEWDIRGREGLSVDSWYLVIANHQTWNDIVVLQALFNRRIPFLKFFIKQQLVWIPFLGMAWWAMDMPFMKRYSKSYLARHPEKKGKDLEATRTACEKFRTTPTTVINFIEGTRFTEEKKARRGSSFEHLLPPRAGGVALAIASMGDMFDAIVDVTIVYPTGRTRFWDIFSGRSDRIVIDITRRPVEEWMLAGDYSSDREYRSRFHRWLTDVWEEKDRRIAKLLEETSADMA